MALDIGKAIGLGIGAKILTDKLGGNDDAIDINLKDFSPFNIGGVSGTKVDGEVNIGATDQRNALVSNLGSAFSSQAAGQRSFLPQVDTTFNKYIGRIENELLPQVKPGFGALSKARADAFGLARERLDNSRKSRVSNLRDDLSRRKIAGSSFAQDTETRTGAEFDTLDRELAVAESEAAAEATMQELEATTQLINESFKADTQRINTAYQITNDAFASDAKAAGVPLDDMNNILQIGSSILNKTNEIAAENARLEAKIAYEEAVGAAEAKSGLGGLIGGGLGMMTGIPGASTIGSALGSALF